MVLPNPWLLGLRLPVLLRERTDVKLDNVPHLRDDRASSPPPSLPHLSSFSCPPHPRAFPSPPTSLPQCYPLPLLFLLFPVYHLPQHHATSLPPPSILVLSSPLLFPSFSIFYYPTLCHLPSSPSLLSSVFSLPLLFFPFLAHHHPNIMPPLLPSSLPPSPGASLPLPGRCLIP